MNMFEIEIRFNVGVDTVKCSVDAAARLVVYSRIAYKQNTYFDGVFYLEYNIKYLKKSASVYRHCLDA